MKKVEDMNDAEIIEYLERINYRPWDKYLWVLLFVGIGIVCLLVGTIIWEIIT